MKFQRLVNVVGGLLLGLMVAWPAAAQAPAGVGEGWLGEFEHAQRQLLQLAEATPADKFSWRPAPGVRSVAEVYMHLGIGNYYLLAQAGIKAPIDLDQPRQAAREEQDGESGRHRVSQSVDGLRARDVSESGPSEKGGLFQKECDR